MNLGTRTVDGIVAAAKRIRPFLLLGHCLFFAGASFAQTKVVDPMHATAPAQLQRMMFSSGPSLPAAKAAESKAVPAAAHAKGAHEGIQVHGYWTIEVRNPDGKVTAHREFENAIQQSGAAFLASLLAANNSSGGLSILLNGARATFQWAPAHSLFGNTTYNYLLMSSAESGPCAPISVGSTFDNGMVIQLGPNGGTTCVITSGPGSQSASTVLGYFCGSSPSTCSTNLVAAGPTFVYGYGPGATQVTLNGSITATESGSGNVDDVETVFTSCDSTYSTPSSCLNYINEATNTSTAVFAGMNVFTERTLDGQGSDPQPVPYNVGQTISVTVTISFQ